jgi:hypothetical protein
MIDTGRLAQTLNLSVALHFEIAATERRESLAFQIRAPRSGRI